jgi:hypothetical protein
LRIFGTMMGEPEACLRSLKNRAIMKAKYVRVDRGQGQPSSQLRGICPQCGRDVSIKMVKGKAVYNSHWSRNDICEGSGKIHK